MTCAPPARRAARALCLAALAMVAARPVSAGQASDSASPTLQVDVQVVDRDGRPIPALTADKFEVEVAGRRRRVVSAEVVDALAAPSPDSLAGRQVYFIAVDTLSFAPGASNAAIAAIRTFIDTLPDGSLLGLVTFPAGPSAELTTDHAAVSAALDSLSGQRPAQSAGPFAIGLSDMLEYMSSPDRTAITQTFCGQEMAQEDGCPQRLEQEVAAAVGGLETQARASLGMLTDFSNRLTQVPARKVVVFVSAGLPVAQRSGGRPDVGTMPVVLAETATRADVAFYTLLLDRLPGNDGGGRASSNASRDREALGRWLDQFSASMAGALVRVQSGQTAEAFERIARETGAYYRLTVESTEADAAERPQRLRVRVDARGATVRARQLVKGR